MRITVIHQHFSGPADAGGARVWQFSKRLAADGHQVTVVMGRGVSSTSVMDGVTMKAVPVKYASSMGIYRRIISFIVFTVRSISTTMRSKPEVVYASSTPLTVAIPAMITKWIFGSRMVFEVRDLWPEVPVALGKVRNPLVIRAAKSLAKMAYRASDTVVALSPFMAEGVLAASPGSRVVTIPNGCDIEDFAQERARPSNRIRDELGISTDTPIVTYAGGFGWLYDIPWGVELAGRLHMRGIHLLFVGDGADTALYKERAAELGLDPEQHFLGRKGKPEVISILCQSDGALSLLRNDPVLEGCSLNKVFDGLAAGLPVFANHSGWQMSEISEMGAGEVLSRDVEAAASELSSRLVSDSWVRHASTQSFLLAQTRYSRDDQYLQLRKAIVVM